MALGRRPIPLPGPVGTARAGSSARAPRWPLYKRPTHDTTPPVAPAGSLAESPHRVGKPLKLGLEGMRSARRGDYRVIYRIGDNQRLVAVIAIEHRSDIYRRRQT